jgi:hypothetical protein
MTAVWGPLGWMTLHSVSTSYPETPTPTERQLLSSWLDMFRDTITCPHCREHFTTMLQNYRARIPTLLDSRQEFSMIVFRAHNAVNQRLSKPVYKTLVECMAVLRTNTQTRPAADYRTAYLNHIMRYWRTFQDITGIVALKKINEMRKIEADYFAPRDTRFTVQLLDRGVVIPREWVEGGSSQTASPSPSLRFSPTMPVRAGFQMIGGRIRLR